MYVKKYLSSLIILLLLVTQITCTGVAGKNKHRPVEGAIAAGDSQRGARAAYTAEKITAQEMLATGLRWTFAPVLGVAQDAHGNITKGTTILDLPRQPGAEQPAKK